MKKFKCIKCGKFWYSSVKQEKCPHCGGELEEVASTH